MPSSFLLHLTVEQMGDNTALWMSGFKANVIQREQHKFQQTTRKMPIILLKHIYKQGHNLNKYGP
jgi:hypothetical protein